MRFLLTVTAFAMAAAASATAQTSPVSARASDIAAFVDRAFATGASAGLGVAVVADGRIVYLKGMGMADASAGVRVTDTTLWYLASTSKSLTAFGLALLEAAGEVDIRAPITRVLPNARWHPDVHPEELNLARFLSHTHGLGNGPVVMAAAFTGAAPEAEWPKLLAYNPPGSTALQYSNLGYNVAAMVIDTKRPEGWKRYLERAVYQPAGMRHTYARIEGLPKAQIAQPHGRTADGGYVTQPFLKRDITMNSAGGHLATLNDLARWTIIHATDGRIDGQQVFPASIVRHTHEPLATYEATFGPFHRTGWGMGWDLGDYEGEPMVSRFGGYAAFRSHLSLLPARHVGVVAMVNTDGGSSLTDIIAAYVFDLALGRSDAETRGAERLRQLKARLDQAPAAIARDAATRAARQRPMPYPLGAYAGTYESPGYGTVTWRVAGDRLAVHWGVLDVEAEVYDSATNAFRAELFGTGSVITFAVDGGGRATSFTLQGITFARRP